MKGFASIVLLLCVVVSVIGQPVDQSMSYNITPTPFEKWNPLHTSSEPYNFQFAFLPTSSTFNAALSYQDILAFSKAYDPAFIVSYEDSPLIQDNNTDAYSRGNSSPADTSITPVINIPFNSTDIIKLTQQAEEHQVPSIFYNHFLHNDVLFLILSMPDSNSVITPEIVSYFKSVLHTYASPRWTVLMLSEPSWIRDSVNNFTALESLLDDRSYTVFAHSDKAHQHVVRNNQRYYVVSKADHTQSIPWVYFTHNGPLYTKLSVPATSEIYSEPKCKKMLSELVRISHQQTTLLVSSQTNHNLGYLELNIHNPLSYPIHFKGGFGPHENVFPSVSEVQTLIYPNARKTLRAQIKTLNDLSTTDSVYLDWNWEARIEVTHGTDVQLTGQFPILFTPTAFNLIPAEQIICQSDTLLRLINSFQTADIRYTLDGSDPDLNSPVYSGPILIRKNTLLKAKLFTLSGAESQVDSCHILFPRSTKGLVYEYHPLPRGYQPENVFEVVHASPPVYSNVAATWDVMEHAKRKDDYALIYRGAINIEETGLYHFEFTSNQMVYLQIDDKMITAPNKPNEPIFLKPGKYPFEITYIHQSGIAGFDCSIIGPSHQGQQLAADMLTLK